MKKTAPALLLLGLAIGTPQAFAGGSFSGASATATISVRILPPRSSHANLTVSDNWVQLNRFGNGAFSVTNNSDGTKNVIIRPSVPTSPANSCTLHYSPAITQIHAGETQIVRVLAQQRNNNTCAQTGLLIYQADVNNTMPIRVAVVR